MDNGDGVEGLWPEHLKYFTGRAVALDVVAERGVFSYPTKSAVQKLGFGARTPAPGFAVPLWPVVGEWEGYQVRPDHPRTNGEGKTLKFEVPHRFKVRVDVHPRVRPLLADLSRPLWITEGVAKADALVTAGAAAVALLGVWMFKGDALADLEWLHLKGRQVFIAFDSDVMLKKEVHGALAGLGRVLGRCGADVAYVYVPHGPGGAKQGVDDFFAAGGTVAELLDHATSELRRFGGDETYPPTSLYPPGNDCISASVPPDLASDLHILDRLADALARCGLTGERASAQLLYLACTSRLEDKPVSAGVKGLSSAGKSFLVDSVARFFDPGQLIRFTALSSRALVYSDHDYRHRMILMIEAEGLREGVEDDLTAYFVRSLLSEGRVDYEVTRPGADGGFTTRHIVKEGPTGLIFTTTRARIHPENETRVLSLTVNDSKAQTAAILAELGRSHATNERPAVDLTEWLQLQTWLQHRGEHRVVIPYAGVLATLIPPLAVRLRRDFSILAALIGAHALLHQVNRPRSGSGAVEATLEDYAVVAALVGPLIAEGVGSTVSDPVRETVETLATIEAETPDSETGVKTHVLADKLELHKTTITRRLAVAVEGGWVVNLEERRRQPARWKTTGEPLPGRVGVLPTSDALHDAWLHQGDASVDGDERPGQDADEPTDALMQSFPGGYREQRETWRPL
jgi:hypothetical protein